MSEAFTGKGQTMAEEQNVRILAWPESPAQLTHRFELDKPCPVAVSFEETPARVLVGTNPQQPLDVNMNMRVVAREPIPLCIKVCEPICARSDYTIGINIFDNPFASITVRGTTRLFNCDDQPPQERCVDFRELKAGAEFAQPFTVGPLLFSPLGAPLRTATFGDPAGQPKLGFPRSGVRITFPEPAHDVRITLNNYAGPTIDFAVFAGATLLASFAEPISNSLKQVTLTQSGITAVEISGGDNEAGLVEVCYTTS